MSDQVNLGSPVAAPAATTGPILQVEGLSKTYGRGEESFTAIAQLDLTVRECEFVSIVGPSGCGKTTLLKCISGLLAPSSGRAVIRGKTITGPPDELAIVFQDYSRSLLPWLTVRKNVALPLRRKKRPAAEKEAAVREALDAVGLSAAGDRYPWQLSGGMQQRVAIARALAYEPKVLLMDEPFASVDAQTRGDLEDLVLAVRREFGITVILVTHDIDESIYMGDRVVVLSTSPSRITTELDVDLPPERDQVETKSLPRFAAMRAEIYGAIRAG
jgi:NitT/TauT family transport system ATP-binding protein